MTKIAGQIISWQHTLLRRSKKQEERETEKKSWEVLFTWYYNKLQWRWYVSILYIAFEFHGDIACFSFKKSSKWTHLQWENLSVFVCFGFLTTAEKCQTECIFDANGTSACNLLMKQLSWVCDRGEKFKQPFDTSVRERWLVALFHATCLLFWADLYSRF
jgi:hypothetical protein